MLIRRTKKTWKLTLRRAALITIFIFITFAVTYYTRSTPLFTNPMSINNNGNLANINDSSNKQISKIGLPIRLEIPIINVDATIDYAGLKSDGTMDIKMSVNEIAWYKFGPLPGEKGSAVIAGHYGHLDGRESMFNDLHKLSKGDKLSIIDSNNKSIIFIVRESRRYDPSANTSDIFTSSDNKSHLNLITCDGAWEKSKNTYSDRLIIFTDKVE